MHYNTFTLLLALLPTVIIYHASYQETETYASSNITNKLTCCSFRPSFLWLEGWDLRLYQMFFYGSKRFKKKEKTRKGVINKLTTIPLLPSHHPTPFSCTRSPLVAAFLSVVLFLHIHFSSALVLMQH